MGWFSNLFHKIGHGISSAVSTVGHGIAKAASAIAKPIYNKVLKPAYEKVVKPAYNKVIKPIATKAFNTGMNFVEGGLDFTNKFVNNARDGALNLEGGALNITKLLSNPFVMIGAGVLGLVIVSKI